MYRKCGIFAPLDYVKKVLRCFSVILFMGTLVSGTAHAAISCPTGTGKKYISCNFANYRLSSTSAGNSCTACPTNSTSEAGNSTIYCTCKTGYTVGGGTNTTTSTTSSACALATYKVTLNNQSATTAGTTEYYYQYNTKNTCYYYTSSALTTCIGGTSGDTITKPTKTGYTFGGYYTATNGGGTQYVDATGLTINNLYKAMAKNVTLYAKWTANTYTCSAGYYLPASSTSCSPCGSNAYYCPGGTYSFSTSAQGRNSVSSGYYSTGGTSTTRTGQSTCGDNSLYCSGGVRKSVTSGYYSTGGTSTTRTGQSICESGYYCVNGVRTACSTIANGLFPNTNGTGSDSMLYCLSDTLAAGSFIYVTSSTSATKFTTCTSGYVCPGGVYSYGIGSKGRIACMEGSYASNNKCVLCSAGYTTNGDGATSCVTCQSRYPDYQPSGIAGGYVTPSWEQGTTTGYITSTNIYGGTVLHSDLVENPCKITTCGAGYYFLENSDSLLDCMGGVVSSEHYWSCYDRTYSNTYGSWINSCHKCIVGTYKSGTNATGYCNVCPAGQTSVAGASSCIACGNGAHALTWTATTPTAGSQWNDILNVGTTVSNKCTINTCASGYSRTDATGLFLGGGTYECTANTYTITYTAGTGGSGANQTQSVTYNSSFTTKAADTFSKANATFDGWSVGNGIHMLASTSYTYTTIGNMTLTATWNCKAGYTLNSSTGACDPCGTGTYKSASGNGACTTCTAGTYNTTKGNTSCTTCPAGKYCTGGTNLTNCAAGTYRSATGGAAASDCSACTGATYSGAGATSCTNCPTGYTANTTSNKTAASQCQIICAAGTRVAATNAACTSPAGGWWTGAHAVNYGTISPVNYCMSGYTSTGTAAANHDAKTDCTRSISGGQYVPSNTIPVRYIKYSSTGSNINNGTHVIEIQAFASADGTGTNLLSGKSGTGTNVTRATDGNWDLFNYATDSGGAILFDLGSAQNIGSIKFAPYTDGRTYYNVTIAVSTDNSNWTTVLSLANLPTQSATTATPELLVLAGVPTNCAAGTAKATHTVSLGSTSSCDACTGRTQYSGTGASSCSTVSAGYYTTGCNASNNNCTGQSQCTGATYCSSGVQNNCPAQTSGWTRGTGTGWTTYSSCYEIQTPANCSSGSVKHTASSASAWNSAVTLVTQLKSNAGYYASSTATSCTICPVGSYCAAGATSATAASTGHYVPSTGQSTQTACDKGKYQDATGQSSCKSCPTVTSGYAYTTTTGLTAVTDCTETKAASSVNSTYCYGGLLTKKATSTTAWGTATSTLTAKAGAHISGTGDNTTCAACDAGTYQGTNGSSSTSCSICTTANTYSAAGASSCSTCPTGYSNSGTTAAAHANAASCKITVSGGHYISTGGQNSTNWQTCAAGTAKAEHTVAYGSTSSCDACTGRTKYSGTGASSCSTVSAGYYTTGCNTSNNNCTGQSQCSGTKYCTNGVANECPNATTYKRTTFPANYYNPVLSTSSVQSANGRSSITECNVISWYTSDRAELYEYATYNSSTQQYDTTTSWSYAAVNAGYYLTSKTGCGSYAYYKEVKECPAGSYCPGKSKVTCNASNQATVHTTNFGLVGCPAGSFCPAKATAPTKCAIGSYTDGGGESECFACGDGGDWGLTTTGTGQTSCNATCANADGVKGWANATWNSNNTVSNLCVPNACDGGYYMDGTTCPSCDSLANGLYPYSPNGKANIGPESCYARRSELNGSYIAKAYDEEATPCPGGSYSFYENDDTSPVVHYGETYSCTTCPANTYTTKEGSTQCTACLENYTTFGPKTSEDACRISCPGGTYLKNARDTECTPVGVGNWAEQSYVLQGERGTVNACPAGTTTIGYGPGADEAADCGHVLHVGESKLYLRAAKKTEHALGVNVGGKTYYGNMSTESKNMSANVNKSLKVKLNNTTYSVYDDSGENWVSGGGNNITISPNLAASSFVPAAYNTAAGETIWSATLSDGTAVSGNAMCSATTAANGDISADGFTPEGDGTGCWCQITAPAQGTKWVYATANTACADKCGYYCANNMSGTKAKNITYRTNLYTTAGINVQ